MMRFSSMLVLICLLAGLRVHAQEPPLALVNAMVYPISSPPLRAATILIAGGKISRVGIGIALPAGARRLDLHGAVVIPGLIETRSSLFLSDGDLAGTGTADQDVLDA